MVPSLVQVEFQSPILVFKGLHFFLFICPRPLYWFIRNTCNNMSVCLSPISNKLGVSTLPPWPNLIPAYTIPQTWCILREQAVTSWCLLYLRHTSWWSTASVGVAFELQHFKYPHGKCVSRDYRVATCAVRSALNQAIQPQPHITLEVVVSLMNRSQNAYTHNSSLLKPKQWTKVGQHLVGQCYFVNFMWPYFCEMCLELSSQLISVIILHH